MLVIRNTVESARLGRTYEAVGRLNVQANAKSVEGCGKFCCGDTGEAVRGAVDIGKAHGGWSQRCACGEWSENDPLAADSGLRQCVGQTLSVSVTHSHATHRVT